jgi:hypothetical protein
MHSYDELWLWLWLQVSLQWQVLMRNTWDRNLITRNYTPVFPQLTESMQVSHAFEVMSDTITKVVGSSGALDSLICR